MTRGFVTPLREPVVSLTVRGPTGEIPNLAVVVDTAYTNHLTLPALVIASLGLRSLGLRASQLADGSTVVHDFYEAVVDWDGREVPIEVDVAETGPIIGMALLAGHRLTVDAVDGGDVTIEALP